MLRVIQTVHTAYSSLIVGRQRLTEHVKCRSVSLCEQASVAETSRSSIPQMCLEAAIRGCDSVVVDNGTTNDCMTVAGSPRKPRAK